MDQIKIRLDSLEREVLLSHKYSLLSTYYFYYSSIILNSFSYKSYASIIYQGLVLCNMIGLLGYH